MDKPQPNVVATKKNVKLVKGSGRLDEGTDLYQYTGDGYLPLAAQTVRARSLGEAIKAINEDLADNDNDNALGEYEHASDPDGRSDDGDEESWCDDHQRVHRCCCSCG